MPETKGYTFKDAEMKRSNSVDSHDDQKAYPYFDVDDLDAEVGDDVQVVLRGKVKSIREDDDRCCVTLEVHEVGIPTDMASEEDNEGSNPADHEYKKMKSKSPRLY